MLVGAYVNRITKSCGYICLELTTKISRRHFGYGPHQYIDLGCYVFNIGK